MLNYLSPAQAMVPTCLACRPFHGGAEELSLVSIDYLPLPRTLGGCDVFLPIFPSISLSNGYTYRHIHSRRTHVLVGAMLCTRSSPWCINGVCVIVRSASISLVDS